MEKVSLPFSCFFDETLHFGERILTADVNGAEAEPVRRMDLLPSGVDDMQHGTAILAAVEGNAHLLWAVTRKTFFYHLRFNSNESIHSDYRTYSDHCPFR